MIIATRGGVRLHVEQAGRGPAVLIISGTGGDLRHRPSPLEWPLVQSFGLTAFDQRGLGRSDRPDGPYTMADYADDAAAVLDAVGLDRAHVLGVSFGGMVAQELAIRHPGRIDRLVLACTSSGGPGGSSYPLHEFADLPMDERAVRLMELSDTRWDASWRSAHPERAARILESFRRPPPDAGGREQLQARSTHDAWSALTSVTIPVLVCAGRYDGIAPLHNSRALADRLPFGDLRVFEGGHLFLAQDPAAFPEITTFFLRA